MEYRHLGLTSDGRKYISAAKLSMEESTFLATVLAESNRTTKPACGMSIINTSMRNV